MRVLLRKMYLDDYDLKMVVKAVHNLFDDYNHKKLIVKGYFDGDLQHGLYDDPSDKRYKKKKDSVSDAAVLKEEVKVYLDLFERKLENIKERFTEDEMLIYKYSVLARLPDKAMRDKICKTDKTYYPIKKSCYVKLALSFDLIDGFTKTVYKTISLID